MHQMSPWDHFEAVTRPALATAPRNFLASIRADSASNGILIAVRRRNTGWIFDHLIGVSQFQGISDRNASSFIVKHGLVSFEDIEVALRSAPTCPRLEAYWTFSDCRYRKAEHACSEPLHIGACTLPQHPTRKGSLIRAAYALFLFIRDVCDGDFVGWIDQRLAAADPGIGAPNRAVQMGAALLDPLRNIIGIGDKVWSMALADLLLAGDPTRERWVTTGAGMVVIDSLLHNHLHRTGVLRRFGAEHPYGPRCYASGGCSDLLRGLAARIDARRYNPTFPASFPRFVQSAIWRLCSTTNLDHCNGNRIDDRDRCQNTACPAFTACDRLALHA